MAPSKRRNSVTQKQPSWRFHLFVIVSSCFAATGCQEFFIQDADREVYRLLEKRQQQALGTTTDVRIDGPAARGNDPSARPSDIDPYAFVPHPVDNDLPESFTKAPTATRPTQLSPEPTTQAAESSAPGHQPPGLLPERGPAESPSESRIADANRQLKDRLEPDAPPPAPVVPTQPTEPQREELTLEQVLAYAFRHSRDFQTAKEQLYLSALDLTLERYLWTPRFFGEVSTLYSIQQSPATDSRGNPTRTPDNALDSVARAGVRQRLPYGGEVVAEVINALMRDVSNHITNGETGQAVIQADLPLLRGAGRAAFESRYQAERNLIYAIRTFEGFRRNLVVNIAADYFNLQRLRQQIINADQSVQSFADLAEQTRALWGTGRRTLLDVQRADQEWLVASNNRVDTVTTYQTALDAFKLRIGMPVETPIDVAFPNDPDPAGPDGAGQDSLAAALRMPGVSEEEAIEAALKYRLDLLNDLDRIGDAERGVNIAENNLLPDLRATSSVRFNTRTEQLGVGHYDDEYNTYQAGLTLELPLDRKAERNLLRQSRIAKNEAERVYEQSRQTVIQQVRNAMRRVEQQELSLQIQTANRDLAINRREAAQIRLRTLGDISNREVVEAENALLAARDRLAASQAQLSLAILQFRRDTGTLRVNDDGQWNTHTSQDPVTGQTRAGSRAPNRPSPDVSSGWRENALMRAKTNPAG